MQVARSGGEAAAEARHAVETRTGVSVVSSKNAMELNALFTEVVETVADSNSPKEKK